MAYQRCRVGVLAVAGRLHVLDLESGQEIAVHNQSVGKGQTITNKNHYRDRAQQAADYEQALRERLGDEYGTALCVLLKRTSPKIYKDQLAGAKQVLEPYSELSDELLSHLCQRPRLTVTALRDYLAAYTSQPERLQQDRQADTAPCTGTDGLARYAELFPELTQEASYELH